MYVFRHIVSFNNSRDLGSGESGAKGTRRRPNGGRGELMGASRRGAAEYQTRKNLLNCLPHHPRWLPQVRDEKGGAVSFLKDGSRFGVMGEIPTPPGSPASYAFRGNRNLPRPRGDPALLVPTLLQVPLDGHSQGPPPPSRFPASAPSLRP